MSYSEFSNMSTGELLFVMVCMLAITVICYCTIPTILRFTLIKKKFLTKGKIIAIAVANSVLIFLIIQILTYDGNGVSLYPAIIWGIVNYFVLTSGNKKYHIQNTETPTSDHAATSLSAGSSTYSYNFPTGNTFNENATENTIHGSAAEIEQNATKVNPTTSSSSQGKKHLPKSTVVCLCIIAVLIISGAIIICNNYDSWKVAQIENELHNTNAISKGDLEYITKLREELLSHDGDVKTFDSYVLNEVKSAFINSIGSNDLTKLYTYRNYLLDNGYTQDMITQELIINSSAAYKFQEAVRSGNENEMITQLSYLQEAGIEYEDANKLYQDAFK